MATQTLPLCRIGNGAVIFNATYDDVTHVISGVSVVNNSPQPASVTVTFGGTTLITHSFPAGQTTAAVFVAPTFKVALNAEGVLDLPATVSLQMGN